MSLRYAAAVCRLTVPYVLDPRLPAPLASDRVSHLVVAVGHGSIELDLPDDQPLDLTAHLHGYVPIARHRQPGSDLDAGDKCELLAQYPRVPYPLLGRLPDPRVERVGRSTDAGEPVQHLLERQQPRDVRHHHPAQSLGQEAGYLAATCAAVETFALVAVGDDDYLPVEDEDVLRQLLHVAVLQRRHLGSPPGLSSPDPVEILRDGRPPTCVSCAAVARVCRLPQRLAHDACQLLSAGLEPRVLPVRRERLPRPFVDQAVGDVAQPYCLRQLAALPSATCQLVEPVLGLLLYRLSRRLEAGHGDAVAQIVDRLVIAVPPESCLPFLVVAVASAVCHPADDRAHRRVRTACEPRLVALVEAVDRGEARLARRFLRVVRVIFEEVLQHDNPAAP
uniref:Uncharacterized protein n=1 Tax=Gibberella zeae TaxID=5518 RepID=A0A4E9DQC2_GIBZA